MQDFSNSVKLFMIFDILGDTERSGPLLWHIDRKRLEDIKNHEMDLLLMFRILRDKLPKTLDDKKDADVKKLWTEKVFDGVDPMIRQALEKTYCPRL